MVGTQGADGVVRLALSRATFLWMAGFILTAFGTVAWDAAHYALRLPVEQQELRDALAENARSLGQLSDIVKAMAKENTEQNAQSQRRLDDHEHRIGDM